ncbi:MAG: DUF1501 domain-containing protein [Verrucomicrobia bacterium]|nr:DUF1501 domain-containing protein [Verrucomicrobiota bacterium]
MLTFLSQPVRHCDGVPRRTFLKAGAFGLAGLTFADLLRAEHAASRGSSAKAVINIHLDGGPPQMDMIDPKPEAPVEFRGGLESIPTKIPGLHISELMPKVASIANKFVFIRSLVGAEEQHHAFQCLSGFEEKDLAGIGGRPALGCVVAKLLGSPKDSAPPFVDLMQGRPLVRNSARPGFLGPAYKPFRPDISRMFHRELEPGMKKELAARGADHTLSLALSDGITVGRLENRVELLSNLDLLRRELDRSGEMEAMDRFTQQAVGILTSGKFAEAMDLGKEDPRVVGRYTPRINRTGEAFYTSEGPEAAQKLLLARRLVEAGVRCVSLSISDFDTHSNNFPRLRDLVPIMDHALHALVTDLEERGMLEDVSIVAWGEFGRTPKVNKDGGRDHWPRVGMAMMAGGGMRVGQVIGSTDRFAAEATSRPVHYQDVIARLYRNLGLDPLTTTVTDTTGRPQFLVNVGQPMRELV